jgi:hypothetical protein
MERKQGDAIREEAHKGQKRRIWGMRSSYSIAAVMYSYTTELGALLF